jgi:hypothetical protein
MPAYTSFDAYFAAQKPELKALIRELRAFVRRTAPHLVESVKWGNGVWLNGTAPVAYVYCAPELVQFGFFRGAKLKDPQGLLEGSGAYVRHIKVRRNENIDLRALAALLRQAAGAKPRA